MLHDGAARIDVAALDSVQCYNVSDIQPWINQAPKYIPWIYLGLFPAPVLCRASPQPDVPPWGRGREGWRPARRFDGPSRRSASGPTRAGRHCAVAAASLATSVRDHARRQTVGGRSAKPWSWACYAARPKWPLAGRGGRWAKADGPGSPAGTVLLDSVYVGWKSVLTKNPITV